MKKTLYLSILAAALMGGQVFADYIPTTTDATYIEEVGIYAGTYSATADVSGANVTINKETEGGDDLSNSGVYGGYTDGEQATASNNKATMTGGQVRYLYGGKGSTEATGNTVIMTGGSAELVYGGTGNAKNTGVASGNVAIVAGDCIVSNTLWGGNAQMGAAANDNKIYLVGKGATATIADAQGKTATYTGGEISVKNIYGGVCNNTSTGNSLDIYGTGITASGMVIKVQLLNFHIAGVLAEADAPMFTSTSSTALNLTRVTLGFCSDDVQDWSAFDGKSITLVDAAKAITVGEGSMGEVAIKGADGATVATATLGLGNENKSLVMSNIKGTAPIPEPTTGTLGLLALAGLCIRRRK